APAAEPALAEGEQGGDLGSDLRLREYQIIVNVLKDTRGSRSGAAERLGISARTLRYKLAKMRECGLDVDEALRAAS
ncbi:MAG: helix-turn-helix domain-containing protein, partial [Pseudomonadales bacterium]|nr:helix-turn-helix domain-containing protein [Pseudomonadales bacterium]